MAEKKAKHSRRKIPIVQKMQSMSHGGFLPFSPGEKVDNMAAFIGYRTQLALHEICIEGGTNIPWDDFVEIVRTSEQLRTAIQAVSIHAVKNFDYGKLDFELPKEALQYIEDDPDSEQITASRIFSKEIGEVIIDFITVKAEQQHFQCLAYATPYYSWKQYLQDLETDSELWDKLIRAVQYGFRQIDFHASWYCEEIEETQFLRKNLES